MVGAGIFSAAGPAAQAAGSGLLLAVGIAGITACLNAITMAQLAARYPESGGAYAYGRQQLGQFWGFLAGWGFVVGKIASCTAMALTFAHYAFPRFAHESAFFAVAALTFVNHRGIKKTALATRILLALVLLTLALVVAASLSQGQPDLDRLSEWVVPKGLPGILEASGIMFFAFAGYARIATLGEEIVSPAATIPKAILIALSLTITLYLIVIGAVMLVVPLHELQNSQAPLALAVSKAGIPALAPLVRVGAALAALSVLLSLLAGISRTVFAMAANRDLPYFFSAVHPKQGVPHRAELLVGVLVAAVVSFADLRAAIGFSSFAILVYYAIANAAAFTLPRESRIYPRWLSVAGLLGCIGIATHLPPSSIAGGVCLFCAGSLIFFVTRARASGKKSQGL